MGIEPRLEAVGNSWDLYHETGVERYLLLESLTLEDLEKLKIVIEKPLKLAEFTTTVNISDVRIKDLLACAFEGGFNYWGTISDYKMDKDVDVLPEEDTYYHISQRLPLIPGCKVIIEELEDTKKQYSLTREDLVRGLAVMSSKYPRHFADFIAENEDAVTGDVFLQCCLFGEVI